MRSSLRARLLGGILLPVVVMVAFDTVSVYRSAISAVHEAYDRQLVAAAHSIGDQLRLEGGRLQLTVPYAVLELNQPKAGSAMTYRVSGFDGQLLWGDGHLPRYQGQLPRDSAHAALVGVVHETVAGEPMRMAVLYQPVDGHDRAGLVLIQVAEPMTNRKDLARGILARTLVMQSTLILAVVGVTLLVVMRALAPLRSLSRQLDDREAADLSPLSVAGAPTELRPVLNALNDFMRRLRQLLGQQQRFVADAAHQLRTPLAVLKTQLQSGLTGAVPPSVLLQEMQGTVQRATELSNQMLSLAKVEQLRERGQCDVCDVHVAAREAAIELSPLVAAQGLDFELAVAPDTDTKVPAHPWLVGELLRNLMHNAIRHTPAGGSLGVHIERRAGGVVVQCWDSGPGIAMELRERVFEPFAVLQPAAAGGSGLGLSICHAIVRSLGGRIELEDHRPQCALPGLRVTVSLPDTPGEVSTGG